MKVIRRCIIRVLEVYIHYIGCVDYQEVKCIKAYTRLVWGIPGGILIWTRRRGASWLAKKPYFIRKKLEVIPYDIYGNIPLSETKGELTVT